MANELQGAISRLLSLLRTKAGALDLSGTARRLSQNLFSRTKSGALDIVGATVGSLTKLASASGILTLTGTAQRLSQNLFSRTKDSALSLAGSAQRLSQNLFSRLKDGALTLTGLFTRLLDSARTKAGSLSFSGALSYFSYEFTPLVQGLISFAGRVWRETPLYGFVYRLLELYRTKAGDLTFSGALSYIESMVSEGVYAGIITTAGSISRYFIKHITKAGTQTYNGTVGRLIELLRTTTGDFTPSGLVRRTNAQVSHLYDGALSFAGEVVRGLFSTQGGTVTLAGEVSRSAVEALYSATGTLELVGAILRNFLVTKTKDGILTLSGIPTGVLTSGINYYWQAVDGVLSITGSLGASLNLTSKAVSGALSPIGRITLIDAVLDRISEAGLVISGSLSKKVVTARTVLSATLTLVGTVSVLKWFKRSGSGVISFAGEVVSYTTGGLWNYSAEGAASFAGALTKLYEILRTYAGSITPSGILSRVLDMGRTVTGAISFAGQALGAFVSRDWNLGYLTLSGAVTPYLVTYRPTYSSALSCTGVVTRLLKVARTVTGVETPSAENPGRYKDILYYGPPNP